MNPDSLPSSLVEAVRFFASDENCHEFLTSMRWGDSVRCGHCDSPKVGKLTVSYFVSRSKVPAGEKPRLLARRVWRCKDCGKQFSVKTGTLFEESPLGLEKWLPALWMICNAKNGISSCELARSLGVTQKSAWHMGHRIRMAMHHGSFMAAGEVESDETFIGGLAGNLSKKKRQQRLEDGIKTGKYPKTIVHGALERTSEARPSRVLLSVLPNTRKGPIQAAVRSRIAPGSKVFTDALNSYRGFPAEYDHEFIDHAITYARGKVHTNGMENFWSLLKRTLGGTYVHVSPAHLFRYLDEQATRFNEREGDDSARFLAAVKRVSGRRLTWDALTAKPERGEVLD